MLYRKGYKYQLAEAVTVATELRLEHEISTDFAVLVPSGNLTLLKGYACDGPSGPTIDTLSSMRGAFFHDALYQFLRLELIDPKYRDTADRLACQLWIEDGMWKWRARWWYKSISKLAKWAANPKNKRTVFETP